MTRPAVPPPPPDLEEIEFRVAPWMFGEGPPDDPFPCKCVGPDCPHSSVIQEWFRRMEARYADKSAPNVWDDGLPPGGYVCAACGQPTESEPCAEHQDGPS